LILNKPGPRLCAEVMTLVPESLALRYGRETQRNLRLKARAIPCYLTLVSRLQGLTAPLTSLGDAAAQRGSAERLAILKPPVDRHAKKMLPAADSDVL
jgi:hypothetical protein